MMKWMVEVEVLGYPIHVKVCKAQLSRKPAVRNGSDRRHLGELPKFAGHQLREVRNTIGLDDESCLMPGANL